MSKERELLKILNESWESGDYSTFCAAIGDAKLHLSALSAGVSSEVPGPAPKSESEAVRLLRVDAIAMLNSLRYVASSRYNAKFLIEREGGDFDRINVALFSLPGPDWRTLATNAFHAWKHSDSDSSTIYYMHEIGDALASEAAVAGKGGE